MKQNQRVAELKEAGKPVIDLGRGNPDLPTFENIVDIFQEAVSDKKNHGYPPYSGKEDFLRKIQTFYEKEYAVELSKNEIAVSQGSTVALSSLAQVLLNPDDIALIPDPSFTGYEAAVKLAGAKPYFVPLKEENQFLLQYDDIPDEISQKAQLLFLNYPNNPTGATATKAFFEKTVEYAKAYNILVIHDFAYADIYFGKQKPISFLEVEGAKDVGVETYTFSKSFNMAGWRSGFIVGNSQVIQGARTYFQNAIGGFFGAIQDASGYAIAYENGQRLKLREIYLERKEIAVELLKKWNWEFWDPEGSFFIWAKVPVSLTSQEFSEHILEHAGVAFVPGTVYGKQGEGWVRISLVTNTETLKEGLEKIKEALLF